jgi:hypothetical protein
VWIPVSGLTWNPKIGVCAFGGMGFGGYGGMGYGGAGPVVQEPVDTGNHHLDKAITNSTIVYHTHEDPPTVQKVDDCYYQNLGSNGGRQT